jgi:hypothetical protein
MKIPWCWLMKMGPWLLTIGTKIKLWMNGNPLGRFRAWKYVGTTKINRKTNLLLLELTMEMCTYLSEKNRERLGYENMIWIESKIGYVSLGHFSTSFFV